ncbi:MAG: MBL fold metallo-hydrolase [Oleibacter sp.]|nr:MBL fold metallo-hydrolase [Thalassolituus sp.]
MQIRIITHLIVLLGAVGCMRSQGLPDTDGHAEIDSAANSIPAHHQADGTFTNTNGQAINKSLGDLIKAFNEQKKPDPVDFPVLTPNQILIENPTANQITWIGHSTFLLQVDGLNILTDPHFTERASPFSFMGPKRIVPPALTLEQLPNIDAVIISHNHYDHMDEDTLYSLVQQQPDNPPHIFVPLGLKSWFDEDDFPNVTELDWWQALTLGETTFVSVPVQHWSARGIFDRNKSLWAGWVIDTPHLRFLSVGDSGYSADFKKIGECFPGIDLAAIPIGAYNPRWFMQDAHMNPDEAVQVFQDLGAEQGIGMHWGTFILTFEEMTEPPKRLHQAMANAQLSPDRFVAMQHGETKILEANQPYPSESTCIQNEKSSG